MLGSAQTDDEGRGRGQSPPSTAPRHDHLALRRLLASRASEQEQHGWDGSEGGDGAGPPAASLTHDEIAVADALASEDAAHEKLERSTAQCADLEHKLGDALAQLDAALQLLNEMRDRIAQTEARAEAAEARAGAAEARAEAAEAREAAMLEIVEHRNGENCRARLMSNRRVDLGVDVMGVRL